jgi:hypothetical protein
MAGTTDMYRCTCLVSGCFSSSVPCRSANHHQPPTALCLPTSPITQLIALISVRRAAAPSAPSSPVVFLRVNYHPETRLHTRVPTLEAHHPSTPVDGRRLLIKRHPGQGLVPVPLYPAIGSLTRC